MKLTSLEYFAFPELHISLSNYQQEINTDQVKPIGQPDTPPLNS